jgi:hypothetical protein
MRAERPVERQRVADGAAVYRQVMRRSMVDRRRAGVEVEASQVQDVAPAEGLDVIAEDVMRQGRILDLEGLLAGSEGDRAGACGSDRRQVERTGFEGRSTCIGIVGAAERQRVAPTSEA